MEVYGLSSVFNWYCFCAVSIEEDLEISNIFYKLVCNSGEKLSRNFGTLNHNLKEILVNII